MTKECCDCSPQSEVQYLNYSIKVIEKDQLHNPLGFLLLRLLASNEDANWGGQANMSTVLVALLIMYIGCGLNGELFPYLLQFVYNYCNGCLFLTMWSWQWVWWLLPFPGWKTSNYVIIGIEPAVISVLLLFFEGVRYDTCLTGQPLYWVEFAKIVDGFLSLVSIANGTTLLYR